MLFDRSKSTLRSKVGQQPLFDQPMTEQGKQLSVMLNKFLENHKWVTITILYFMTKSVF